MEPLPGRNAFIPSRPEEKVVNYPARPVDSNTHFEGTATIQPPQQAPPPNAGNMQGSHINRNVPRQMNMVGMQRVPPQGIAPYNISSQAGMGGAMNPGGIPMQRGVANQGHPQQQLRRKDPGMLPGYPTQQKSRRF